jgi:hypothetical protein
MSFPATLPGSVIIAGATSANARPLTGVAAAVAVADEHDVGQDNLADGRQPAG